MKPIEDTFILEGLVQGPVPDNRDGPETLQRFASDVAGNRLPLSVEITGGQFSFLADGQPHLCSDLHPKLVSACLQQALEQLLELLPPLDRPRVISSLRLQEFQLGIVRQTLFTIKPPGQVQLQTRESPADVISRSVVRSQLMKRRIMIGGLAVVGGGILATVAAFKPWLQSAATKLKFQPPTTIPVDVTSLAEGITATATVGETLEITLTHGPQWEALLQAPTTEPDWSRHLASAALHRGHAMVFLLDASGKAIHAQAIDLTPLSAGPTCIVNIPLARQGVHFVMIRP